MGVAAGSIYTLLAPSHGTVLQTRLQSVSDLQDEIYPHTRLLGFCHPWCPARQSHSRDSSLQMYSEISETAVSRQQSARCMDPRRPGPWHPSVARASVSN